MEKSTLEKAEKLKDFIWSELIKYVENNYGKKPSHLFLCIDSFRLYKKYCYYEGFTMNESRDIHFIGIKVCAYLEEKKGKIFFSNLN